MLAKPCWVDSIPLDLLYGWIPTAAVIILIVLAAECAPTPAHADTGLYLDLAGGLSHFTPTLQDGDWHQQGLPHKFDKQAFAFRVGAGYRFSDRWAIEAHYLNLGTTRVFSTFVNDPDYNLKTKSCIANCTATGNLTASSAYQGVDLAAVHTWRTKSGVDPFIKFGAAYLLQRFTIENYNQSFTQKHYGRIPAGLIGGGLSYKWAYVEADYYHGIGGPNSFAGQPQGYPISKQILVVWAGIQVPLTF